MLSRNGAINVKMDVFLEKKSSSKTPRLSFSSKINCNLCVTFINKLFSNNIETLVPSMSFHFPVVSLYLYKYTIQSCMVHCHIWAGTSICHLEMLDKLQNEYEKVLFLSFQLHLNSLVMT